MVVKFPIVSCINDWRCPVASDNLSDKLSRKTITRLEEEDDTLDVDDKIIQCYYFDVLLGSSLLLLLPDQEERARHLTLFLPLDF